MSSAAPGWRVSRAPSAAGQRRAPPEQISATVPGGASRSAAGISSSPPARLGPVDKDERGRARIEGDEPLGPARRAAHELPDRQRVEEFVGDQQQRPVGQVVEIARAQTALRREPLRLRRAQAPGSPRPDAAAARGGNPGTAAARAQHIGHQRAAAGPQLDQEHRVGRAHPLPQIGAPQPDQLAENLADLGRGDEIAVPRRSDRGVA